MSWRAVLEDRCRLGGLKEASLTVYLSCGSLFEDWLKVSLDDLISGDSQTASNLIGEYVNGYLRSASESYRRSVLKHLSAIFRLCGRLLLVRPSAVLSGLQHSQNLVR
mgnify:CR=1 FL=1